MSELPGFTALTDKRVKKVDYIECMYVTEDDKRLLFRIEPKDSGVEEGIISVYNDAATDTKVLNMKYHFNEHELRVIEIGV